jgi:hypothetical protein
MSGDDLLQHVPDEALRRLEREVESWGLDDTGNRELILAVIKDLRATRNLLGQAAREIPNCSGPVHERIRWLRLYFSGEILELEKKLTANRILYEPADFWKAVEYDPRKVQTNEDGRLAIHEFSIDVLAWMGAGRFETVENLLPDETRVVRAWVENKKNSVTSGLTLVCVTRHPSYPVTPANELIPEREPPIIRRLT